jgi:two-component system C4-dicarboxylate transport sensor histidine kinase DctB
MSKPPDLASEFWNCADLATVVAHEFNNVLNNIQLQLAVIELKGGAETVHAELNGIRQIANNAAAMVRQFQAYGRKHHPPLAPVDLNAAVNAAVSGRAAVQLRLHPNLPLILGTEADIQRLIRLLLPDNDALGSGAATITTEPDEGQVVVRMTDSGPQIPNEFILAVFEPFAVARPGYETWTLAVCKALVRRLQGTIDAANRPEGGMVFTIRFRIAP